MKVEEYDGFIIRIGPEYLVAIPYEDFGTKRLSNSKYDAALIKDEIVAGRIAAIVGGEVLAFNPVTGRIS